MITISIFSISNVFLSYYAFKVRINCEMIFRIHQQQMCSPFNKINISIDMISTQSFPLIETDIHWNMNSSMSLNGHNVPFICPITVNNKYSFRNMYNMVLCMLMLYHILVKEVNHNESAILWKGKHHIAGSSTK